MLRTATLLATLAHAATAARPPRATLLAALFARGARGARPPRAHCRAMQSARRAGVSVQNTAHKGLGAFTRREIARGEPLGFYEGEICTRAEVASRYWDGDDGAAKFEATDVDVRPGVIFLDGRERQHMRREAHTS